MTHFTGYSEVIVISSKLSFTPNFKNNIETEKIFFGYFWIMNNLSVEKESSSLLLTDGNLEISNTLSKNEVKH